MSQPRTVELDVRPHLRKKLEPFQLIMDAVKSLEQDDTFVLHATFKPTPLLMVMKGKGYRNTVHQLAEDHWVTTFVHKSRPLLDESIAVEAPDDSNSESADDGSDREAAVFLLDNRGMQPPAPMIRTLKKLEQAQSGDTVIIHNDRVPMFLIEELHSLGYRYEIEEQQDGSAKVAIQKS
jgi:uncharacterized protein (DUF2249 family)